MENNWEDIFRLDDQLSEEERMIRDNVREYCQKSLMPRILESNRNETFHPEIFKEMGDLGILGATIKGYGCAGINYVSYGLITREIQVTALPLACNLLFQCTQFITSALRSRKMNYCLKWQKETLLGALA